MLSHISARRRGLDHTLVKHCNADEAFQSVRRNIHLRAMLQDWTGGVTPKFTPKAQGFKTMAVSERSPVSP